MATFLLIETNIRQMTPTPIYNNLQHLAREFVLVRHWGDYSNICLSPQMPDEILLAYNLPSNGRGILIGGVFFAFPFFPLLPARDILQENSLITLEKLEACLGDIPGEN
ncbi:MAG: hypothetical protein N3D76_10005 [Geminocystis sp.]|nr:hypothetical protein [Geminocystis sp.]HIK36396.1 hypothetical protein [Geminocystis sp. M7585_C2015_104]